MEKIRYCVNHPIVMAKRFCKKCEEDLCTDCALDLHIDHHQEITLIEGQAHKQIDDSLSKEISEQIKLVVNESLESIKPSLQTTIENKIDKFLQSKYKNYQEKINEQIKTLHLTNTNVDNLKIGGVKKQGEQNTNKNPLKTNIVIENISEENKGNVIQPKLDRKGALSIFENAVRKNKK